MQCAILQADEGLHAQAVLASLRRTQHTAVPESDLIHDGEQERAVLAPFRVRLRFSVHQLVECRVCRHHGLRGGIATNHRRSN
jgi:hypothetical protein